LEAVSTLGSNQSQAVKDVREADMRYPDGYTPPRRIVRPIWPRLVVWTVCCASAWFLVFLLVLAVKSVISLFR